MPVWLIDLVKSSPGVAVPLGLVWALYKVITKTSPPLFIATIVDDADKPKHGPATTVNDSNTPNITISGCSTSRLTVQIGPWRPPAPRRLAAGQAPRAPGSRRAARRSRRHPPGALPTPSDRPGGPDRHGRKRRRSVAHRDRATLRPPRPRSTPIPTRTPDGTAAQRGAQCLGDVHQTLPGPGHPRRRSNEDDRVAGRARGRQAASQGVHDQCHRGRVEPRVRGRPEHGREPDRDGQAGRPARLQRGLEGVGNGAQRVVTVAEQQRHHDDL